MGGPGREAGRPELVRARRRKGMSQEAAAEAVGVSPTTWARWERGEQGVRARHRARMAAVFGVEAIEVERWVEGWAFVETPCWPLVDCGSGSLEATVKSADLLWRFEMDPSRRHLLATLPFVPAALGEWLTSWTYDTPAASTAHTGPGRAVGMADVTRINEARQAFSQMDHQFGAGLVRPVVLRYLNSNVAPLLRGRYDDQVGAELLSAAAGMSRMAGWTAFDMSLHGQAQQHFGQALKFAKAGDDGLTAAWVLTAMIRQAIHIDQAAWALRLARAAAETARRAQASPRVMALMTVREAWATALQTKPAETGDRHNAKQVQHLLAEAERAYEQGPTDRDPAWIALHEVAELNAEAGQCWALLGEHQRAAACAEAAVNEFRERLPRSAQFNRVHAADAYLRMSELEQALDSARAAIPMAKALSSARSIEFIQAFADRLEPYGKSVAVREFRDHLRSELAA
ncbi:helix-turn-helix transcriptional regulator [Sphaerisporangium perillae]|uniref:helix-turn-helix transcriptional regulator n=1 Tax=Sphaerisporangium perillae TaxID=2935860 RepID=UPI00200FDF61|nr:helix-turn-helix transcriptional regulator [Sphaerisporangium perillae]